MLLKRLFHAWVYPQTANSINNVVGGLWIGLGRIKSLQHKWQNSNVSQDIISERCHTCSVLKEDSVQMISACILYRNNNFPDFYFNKKILKLSSMRILMCIKHTWNANKIINQCSTAWHIKSDIQLVYCRHE